MILRRKHPLVSVLLAACLIFTSHSLSFPLGPVPARPAWLATVSLASHSREFSVVANDNGIPQLEEGESPAADPTNVIDRPVRAAPPPRVPGKKQLSNDVEPLAENPVPSAEFLEEGFVGSQVTSDSGEADDAFTEQPTEPEEDKVSSSTSSGTSTNIGSDEDAWPESVVTALPGLEGPEQANSQAFISPEGRPQSPEQSNLGTLGSSSLATFPERSVAPSLSITLPVAEQVSVKPSPSLSPFSTTPKGTSSTEAASVTPTVSPENVSKSSPHATPSTAPGSFLGNKPKTPKLDGNDEPGLSPNSVQISSTLVGSRSPSPIELSEELSNSPSPAKSDAPSLELDIDSPGVSDWPQNPTVEDIDVLIASSAPGSNIIEETMVTLPVDNIPVFVTPSTSQVAIISAELIPQPSGSLAVGNSGGIPEPTSPTINNPLPSQMPKPTDVKPIQQPLSFPLALESSPKVEDSQFESSDMSGSVSDPSILNSDSALMNSSPGLDVEELSPFSQESPIVTPGGGVGVGREGSNNEIECLYFGSGSIPGFEKPDSSSITGSTSQFSVGRKVFPNLSSQYLSHTHGQVWSYQVTVEANKNYEVVLGFAEIEASCRPGSLSGFRQFVAAVGNQRDVIDVAAEVGCGAVLKKAYNVSSSKVGLLKIALRGLSQQAMLSTLCYRALPLGPNIGNVTEGLSSNIGSLLPTATAVPTSVEPSPLSSFPDSVPSPTRTAPSTSRDPVFSTGAFTAEPEEESSSLLPSIPSTCYKFGDNIVPGYSNVQVPDMGSGVDFFENSLAQVSGTNKPEVYSSHIFGKEFIFSANTQAAGDIYVILSFAEVYKPACKEGYRVFRTKIGSKSQIVDVFKEAGCGRAFDVRFDDIVPSPKGVIEISLKALENFAMLSSVCVYEGSTGGISNVRPSDSGNDDGNSTGERGAAAQVSSSIPSTDPILSEKPTSTPAPNKSPLPKENGMLVSLPEETPIPSSEDILLHIGITSENSGVPGSITSPQPSVASNTLLESNFFQTLTGHSENPTPSPLNPQTFPIANAEGVDAMNSVPIVSATPSPDPPEVLGGEIVQSPETSAPTISIAGLLPSSILPDPNVPRPSTTPLAPNALAEPSPTAVDFGDEEGTEFPVLVIPNVSPSLSPSKWRPTLSPSPEEIIANPSLEAEFSNDILPTSPEPQNQQNVLSTVIPVVGSINAATNGQNGIQENQEVVLSVPGFEQSGEMDQSQKEPIVPTASYKPPALGDRQPIVFLPPVGGTIPIASPSVTAIIPGVAVPVSTSSSPAAIPVLVPIVPTITPVPTVVVPAPVGPSPLVSAPPSNGEVETQSSPVPSPFPVGDSPSGVVIDEETQPVPSTASSAEGSSNASSSLPPSPTMISSVTGADEVIVEGLDTALSPAPIEPDEEEIAPPLPVSGASEDGSEAIQITDGSAVTDEEVQPDASGDGGADSGPTIIAGPFKDMIATRSQGSGFSIGMGILGALLLLLLLICLFFAIFRGRGGSYSYSSQYSAHKPTDFDPSQGGYTDDLGLGNGDYSYGTGGQNGYTGGGNTLDSRPNTQTGSFAYEGAGEGDMGGTIGSGYTQNEVGDGLASGFQNDAPDTFAEYSSLNMQEQSTQYGNRGDGANSGDYTPQTTIVDYGQATLKTDYTRGAGSGEYTQGTNTGEYTKPATTAEYALTETFTGQKSGMYTAEMQETEYRTYLDSDRSLQEASEHTAIQIGDSFNGDHSVAQPNALQSESGGKQERSVDHAQRGSEQYELGSNSQRTATNYASTSRGSVDKKFSTESSISIAGRSPYESNTHLISSGNVYKSNSISARAPSATSANPVHADSYLSDRVDAGTETSRLFMRDDSVELRTDYNFSDRADEAHVLQASTRHRSELSEEGPWPAWWSEKKVLRNSGTIADSRNGIPLSGACNISFDGASDQKENDRLRGKRPVFRIHSLREGEDISSPMPREGVTPLSRSSRENVIPVLPSQIIADADWRRASESQKHFDFTGADLGPDGFEELRRRREPYVKKVANRLSVNRSTSSRSSGVSEFQPSGPSRGYYREARSSNSKTASWIPHNTREAERFQA